MKIRTLKFFFFSLIFIHCSALSFSQDFVKELDENTLQFSKTGTFRFTLTGTEILISGESSQLAIKDPVNKNTDSTSIRIITLENGKPTILTDTFSIKGTNNAIGVLFVNSKEGSSTKVKITKFKWVDATKYKARITWVSPDNQSTITLDFIEVRQEPSKKGK